MMKGFLIAGALALAVASGFSQDAPAKVSVAAKGDDVRSVIHDLFKQAGKNYVLKPGVRFVLYLSLDNVEFEEALTIICKNATLDYRIEKGVYYIGASAPKPADNPKPLPQERVIESEEPVKPKGTLPTTVLAKRVTTRLQKRSIREVMGFLSKQTGLTIEVSKDVPDYKLDVFFLNTSLKYALDEITVAAKLKYRLTDQLSIAIEKLPPTSPLSGPIGG
jgi:type II secretory pathway component GspD/PulD (secretin)